jgi:hypothetical protein
MRQEPEMWSQLRDKEPVIVPGDSVIIAGCTGQPGRTEFIRKSLLLVIFLAYLHSLSFCLTTLDRLVSKPKAPCALSIGRHCTRRAEEPVLA